ncbi:MAG: sirohydrochlorin cobaltochelatase [Firmicutes bacterium]|nr:sirohydrochlorin cobaltochelatase [Bacillota bacterium]
MKKAILVISFGTSYPDTLEKTIAAVENRIRNEFKTEVFRTFTSGMIIKKLGEQSGIHVDTVTEALDKLYSRGYTDIFCVPTHIMNGAEYDKACKMIDGFKDKMNISVSRPLISITEDYFEIVNIFKKRLTDKNRLYIFMGHGSEHFANSLYSALDYHFKDAGMSNVYVGTVEGFPDLDTVIKQAKRRSIKSVTLLPLMLVCGDHAQNDMAVEWKKAFEDNGFDVDCSLAGLGETDEIQEMYCEHLRNVFY